MQRLKSLGDMLADVEWDWIEIELTGFDLGEVENVVDDRSSASAEFLAVSRYSRCSPVSSGVERQVDHARSRRSSACGFHGSRCKDTARVIGYEERGVLGIDEGLVVGDDGPQENGVGALRFRNAQLVGCPGSGQRGQTGGLSLRRQECARKGGQNERQPEGARQ